MHSVSLIDYDQWTCLTWNNSTAEHHSTFGLEIVTGTQTITSKWSHGSAVYFNRVWSSIFWKKESRYIQWHRFHLCVQCPYTVKASNFGEFFFFQKGLLSSKRVLYRKMNGNKRCRKTLDLQTLFCSCFVPNSSKDANDLAKMGPNFPRWGAKLEAFTVIQTALTHLKFETLHLSSNTRIPIRLCEPETKTT